MKPYFYIAEVVKVYDGDTCTCVVDLGFKLSARIKVRLVGIDTPEIRTKDLEEKKKGKETRDWLRERILGKKVMIHTEKTLIVYLKPILWPKKLEHQSINKR